jgi:hypothetical protein
MLLGIRGHDLRRITPMTCVIGSVVPRACLLRLTRKSLFECFDTSDRFVDPSPADGAVLH